MHHIILSIAHAVTHESHRCKSFRYKGQRKGLPNPWLNLIRCSLLSLKPYLTAESSKISRVSIFRNISFFLKMQTHQKPNFELNGDVFSLLFLLILDINTVVKTKVYASIKMKITHFHTQHGAFSYSNISKPVIYK